MPFVLKRQGEEFENAASQVFNATIKIGSDKNNDLIINSSSVLPFHAELYSRFDEYRIAPAISANITINQKEVEKWPALLKEDDIISFGEIDYVFHVLQPIIPRSWKAGFASYLAIFLLFAMIVFEVFIIVWLPYSINNQKYLDLVATKQEVFNKIDKLRDLTNRLQIPENDSTNASNVKALLLANENDIANYLRLYGDKMNWDQTRTVYRDISQLNSIVGQWSNIRDIYFKRLTLNPDKFINDIIDRAEKTSTNKLKTTNNPKDIEVNLY